MPRGLKHVTLEDPPSTVKTPGKKEIKDFEFINLQERNLFISILTLSSHGHGFKNDG
jgi:hypothetical protein